MNINCIICGKEFYARPSEIVRGKKYCSRECYGKASMILKECLVCHKLKPSTKMRGNYCSPECRWADERQHDNAGTRAENQWQKDRPKMMKNQVRSAKLRVQNEGLDNFIQRTHLAMHKRPTAPERIIIDICDSYFPVFKYNGDFSQGVCLNRMFPDFINTNGKKQVIEVFGNYWHQHKDGPEFNYINENTRIEKYKTVGFDCLVLWEHDIKKMGTDAIKEKIANFTNRELQEA